MGGNIPKSPLPLFKKNHIRMLAPFLGQLYPSPLPNLHPDPDFSLPRLGPASGGGRNRIWDIEEFMAAKELHSKNKNGGNYFEKN